MRGFKPCLFRAAQARADVGRTMHRWRSTAAEESGARSAAEAETAFEVSRKKFVRAGKENAQFYLALFGTASAFFGAAAFVISTKMDVAHLKERISDLEKSEKEAREKLEKHQKEARDQLFNSIQEKIRDFTYGKEVREALDIAKRELEKKPTQ
eukprot:Colp12_sorted_trinity150504_noHs@8972